MLSLSQKPTALYRLHIPCTYTEGQAGFEELRFGPVRLGPTRAVWFVLGPLLVLQGSVLQAPGSGTVDTRALTPFAP